MSHFNIETIPAGTYAIEHRGSKTLRAFLGSCVGLVLIDKKSGVGGLLHILLPEPPARASIEEPEKYASTAVPVFIAALLTKCAKKENLEAFIAGGSLVGQVSMMDLKLDIGGQSAEVVENYVKLEGINVGKIETGGYISNQISLDMNKMECTIDPILNIHPMLDGESEKKVEIDFYTALSRIKPIPQIALKVKIGRASCRERV